MQFQVIKHDIFPQDWFHINEIIFTTRLGWQKEKLWNCSCKYLFEYLLSLKLNTKDSRKRNCSLITFLLVIKVYKKWAQQLKQFLNLYQLD